MGILKIILDTLSFGKGNALNNTRNMKRAGDNNKIWKIIGLAIFGFVSGNLFLPIIGGIIGAFIGGLIGSMFNWGKSQY